MSGPKVVRIVTREEIEAICRRHISTVMAAVREFTRRGERCDKLDGTIKRALAQRIASLEALFARGEWMAVQKQAPETVTFLRAEGDRLEKVATDEAMQARSRRRRTMDAAKSVASALQAADIPIDPELKRAVEGRAASLDDADQAIAAGLAALPARAKSTVNTAERAELAARLSKGETGHSINDLVAGKQPEASPGEQRLDALLAELHVLGDAAKAFVERADAIAAEGDAARRRLLSDSLVMEAAAQVTLVRKRETIDSRLRQAAASLESVDTPEAGALQGKLNASIGQTNEGAANGLLAEVAAMIEAHAQTFAAAARRRAVLSGLSSLGYEIREGMSSAWERDGRIIVRKPGATDYGVELGAPANATRFQVRVVGSTAPEMPRDTQRDADQEVIWCNEFDQLRAGLSTNGDEIVLEKAVEAGKQPLRSMEIPRTLDLDAAMSERTPVTKRAM